MKDDIPIKEPVPWQLWVFAAICLASSLIWFQSRTATDFEPVTAFTHFSLILIIGLILWTRSFSIALLYSLLVATSFLVISYFVWESGRSFANLSFENWGSIALDSASMCALWLNREVTMIYPKKADWIAFLWALAVAASSIVVGFGISLFVPWPLPYLGIGVLVLVGAAFVLARNYYTLRKPSESHQPNKPLSVTAENRR